MQNEFYKLWENLDEESKKRLGPWLKGLFKPIEDLGIEIFGEDASYLSADFVAQLEEAFKEKISTDHAPQLEELFKEYFGD